MTFKTRADEEAWLTRILALEEELGPMFPSGAAGGIVPAMRRREREMVEGYFMTPERREQLGQVIHAQHQRGAQAKLPEFPDYYVPPAWEELQEHERDCYRAQAEAVVRDLLRLPPRVTGDAALELARAVILRGHADTEAYALARALVTAHAKPPTTPAP